MARTGHQRSAKADRESSSDRAQIGGHAGPTGSTTFLSPFRFAPARLEKLKERGFSNDEVYKIVAPRRTLARRKELQQDLTVAESGRVLRLERISDMADRVFGSPEKARRWLRSEIIALDGARPIDLLTTEIGAYEIEQELIRIDYGMLA